jgi:hypothetical protein
MVALQEQEASGVLFSVLTSVFFFVLCRNDLQMRPSKAQCLHARVEDDMT